MFLGERNVAMSAAGDDCRVEVAETNEVDGVDAVDRVNEVDGVDRVEEDREVVLVVDAVVELDEVE